MRIANTHIKDYVIYDNNECVIAIGTRPEIREQTGWTENTAQNYLAVPPVGFAVVVFKKGKYECTRIGTEDEEAWVFRVTNPCKNCKHRCMKSKCQIDCGMYINYRAYRDKHEKANRN